VFLTLLFALLAPTVEAQPRPDFGSVHFELSRGARLELFPRVDPRKVEVAIYDQREPIHRFIDGISTYFLLDIDGYSIGGGVWLVSLYLDRDGLEVELRNEGEDWQIEIQPGQADVIDLGRALDAKGLLNPKLERDVAPPPASPLHPLSQEAVTIAINPREYDLYVPEWEPELPARRPDNQLLEKQQRTTLRDIDGYRRIYTESPLQRSQQIALYRMGTGYLEMGLHREALYYLDELAKREGSWDPEVVHLLRAQAAISMGNWKAARARCEKALEVGAREERVLECLGVVSLATANPSPTATARALGGSTGRPEALLLAGQLLQLDNRHREAEPLLRVAASKLDGTLKREALLNLGDALFAHGDLAGAREAWRYVGTDGELGDILYLRQHMTHLVEQGPREWAGAIPRLYIEAKKRNRAGAEAGYLLAQITEALGDTAGASEHLATLLDRQSWIVEFSDVPERLWRIIARRLSLLQRQGRSLEQVAFYRDFYRTKLRGFVDDTTQLEGVANAYEELGLYGHALNVQREVFTIHSQQNVEDLPSLLHLVRLYVQTGRPQEALETTAYMRRIRGFRESAAPVEIYEGRSYEALGRFSEAKTSYEKASSNPAYRMEAVGRLALMNAADDRCEEALPGLQELSTALPGQAPDDILDGRVHIALARCLLAEDRPAEALVAAADGAGRSDDELHKRYATYLAAIASRESGSPAGELYQEALEAYDDLWASLGREAVTDAEFQKALDAKLKE
jgi:tetratricopeptide (TPR) repeat protein